MVTNHPPARQTGLLRQHVRQVALLQGHAHPQPHPIVRLVGHLPRHEHPHQTFHHPDQIQVEVVAPGMLEVGAIVEGETEVEAEAMVEAEAEAEVEAEAEAEVVAGEDN
jgi:hypothetical protein